jgi:hypothetical protein
MKRIYPTRKERADTFVVSQLSYSEARNKKRYSGRPTRRQRRKMRHLREWSARPAVRMVDGMLVWARNVKAGETFTLTIEQMQMVAQQTITINGEQVPATIVKDPTK